MNKVSTGKSFFNTPCPEPLFPKSFVDSSVLAHELNMKYNLSLPFYRSTAERCREGAPITANDLYTWSINLYEKKFVFLMPLFWDELLKNPEEIIQADETTFLVLRLKEKEPGQKSYIWSYNTCKFSKHKIHIYSFETGRSGDFPADKLLNYVGYLVTDGYPGYNKVANIIRIMCWIHARRKFVEAYPSDSRLIPVSKQYEAVQKIDKLFEEDEKLQNLDPETRKAERNKLMRPIIEALYDWFDEIKPEISKKSKLAEAINYCENNRKELMNFLENGNLPLHNQVSEQSIRNVAVGRKNYMLYGSQRGANAGMCFYTTVQSANANGLDSELYLKYLMDHMKGNNFDRSPEALTNLMPWSEQSIAACKTGLVYKKQYDF